MSNDLKGLDIFCDENKLCVAPLDSFCSLVGAFLDLSGVSGKLKGFQSLICEFFWNIETKSEKWT
jgi:hypothetical protein